jgi:hypothetical protein
MENTLARKLKQVPEGYLSIGVDPHKKRHASLLLKTRCTSKDSPRAPRPCQKMHESFLKIRLPRMN